MVRSLLVGLTNFMVLEFFVATKLSLCHSPFPRSGTVLRANLHPTSSSSLCSTCTTLKLQCLHVVTCLVFTPCVSGNIKYCRAARAVHHSWIIASWTLTGAGSKSYRL